MENTGFKTERTTGFLLILGGALLFIPYTILTISFDYPDVLREDSGEILRLFKAGGAPLIWTWFAFALVGLPLLGAYSLLGQKLETRLWYVRLATGIGTTGLVVQMIGLLRWTFVVPMLADQYAAGNEMTREAAVVAFRVIHQYGGVVLGEHLGQLFTIAWTLLIATALGSTGLIPRWLKWMAYVASCIYLAAQAELFATVLPGFPVWDPAGFLGSTLWLVWLILVGVRFLKMKSQQD